jgi:hypothetical protein
MQWIDELRLDRFNLMPSVDFIQLTSVEAELGYPWPTDYREFLKKCDGGQLGNFILLSAGAGIHPEETLTRANSEQSADYPVFCIGRDAYDDFGFRKCDLQSETRPVFFVSHETWELNRVADSFKELLQQLVSLEPGQSLLAKSINQKK